MICWVVKKSMLQILFNCSATVIYPLELDPNFILYKSETESI